MKHLVAEAAERPAADRERFLAERCEDPALRAELLALVAADVALTDVVADAMGGTDVGPGTQLGS